MALPNHPDVACAFVRTLADCGYQWVLLQEHTVEQPGGRGVEHPHLPHRLVCTDYRGTTARIIAVIKTQGSDTKLVATTRPQACIPTSWPAGRLPRWSRRSLMARTAAS
jgi:hypothetical protein